MTKKLLSKAEAGIAQIAVIIIVLVLIGGAVGIYFMVRSENKPTTSDQSDAQSATETVDSRNNLRQADASSLMGAASEYQANNTGSLPAGFSEGNLIGPDGSTPSAVVLEYYPVVVFASGVQPAQTSTSELRLVTNATCGEGGATVAGSSRAFAAQFATENADGDGYTSECKEG